MKSTEPILVVDDDESYRALLRHHLEALGYEVLEAGDGVEACSIASQRRLRLMILDVVMPNAEGLETISRLRQAGVATKILAVSGAGKTRAYLDWAVRMGADAKFEKMGPMSELLKVVASLANPAARLPRSGGRVDLDY